MSKYDIIDKNFWRIALSNTNLTDEQRRFAETTDTHVLVLAAAGSGKTSSCVCFIEDKIKRGVKPEEIIAFSFTRKAANELKERVNAFFLKKNYDFKYISTVHSFCWNELIKNYYLDIGYAVVPTIIHEFPEEFMEADHKKYGKKRDRSSYNKYFSQLVSKDLHGEDFQEKETARLLEYLVLNNLVMFDFMIHLANFILEDDDCSSRIHETFKNVKYIITDEAQDLNDAQYRFLKLLRDVTGE